MTVREALAYGSRLLQEAGMAGAEARRDAQVLLGHVLHAERAMLYAHPERTLTTGEERQFEALLARRRRGEPVAYLVGQKEFYGLEFLVDRRVLIPRPETELLVEEALAEARRRLERGQTPLIADVGTGSGAIAIALAVAEPRLPLLYAIDLSPEALAVARLNCERHGVAGRVRLLQGDLLEPLPEPVDLLVANLPYVGTEEQALLAADVRAFEPAQALFAGPHGLDLLGRFLQQIAERAALREGGLILLEIGYQQRAPLERLVRALWPQAQIVCKQDYAGLDRLLTISPEGPAR
jgi:release factor glutamine methyltransferase